MNLFPMIQPQTTTQDNEYPLYKEVKWDYLENIPVFKNGSPEIVTGPDAVMTWAWKSLQTVRYRHEIYSWGYGNELESLIGQNFTEELKRSEAARYLRECLLVNPYISAVKDIAVEFEGSELTCSCSLETVYGTLELEGEHV